jgi:hypothetical protein
MADKILNNSPGDVRQVSKIFRVSGLKIYRDHSQRHIQRDIKKIQSESLSKVLKRPTKCRRFHREPSDKYQDNSQ